MIYFTNYGSPLGNILLAADDEGLTTLDFSEKKGRRFPQSSDPAGSGALARYLFFGKESQVHAAAPFVRHAVPDGSLAPSSRYSLWKDDDLRRVGKRDRPAARRPSYVGAGHRRGGGTQPGGADRPLPPRDRRGRQPDRIRRRPRQKSQSFVFGRNNFSAFLEERMI